MATKAELRQIAERLAHQILRVQEGPKFEELAGRFENEMEALTSGKPGDPVNPDPNEHIATYIRVSAATRSAKES